MLFILLDGSEAFKRPSQALTWANDGKWTGANDGCFLESPDSSGVKTSAELQAFHHRIAEDNFSRSAAMVQQIRNVDKRGMLKPATEWKPDWVSHSFW